MGQLHSDRVGLGKARLWVVVGSGAVIVLLLLLLGLNHDGAASSVRPSSANTQPYTPPPPSLHQPPPNHAPASAPPDHDILDDVYNATLGFQKIFVVSMPYRTDRRDAMSLAAAFSNLEVEYADGIAVAEENFEAMKKLLPPGGYGQNWKTSGLGAWRAHMNVIRKIVEQNLTSALIMEDDVDWDIRIKPQMRDFARATQMLVQPLAGSTNRFLDPTYPSPSWGQTPTNFDLKSGVTTEPTTSPYGDVSQWDLLWLGHCGTVFPTEAGRSTPLGRVVVSDDDTVPEPQHIDMQAANKDLMEQYPPHTRVVSRTRRNLCSSAYAISRAGARRLLWEMGVHHQDSGAMDIMLARICDGEEGRKMATCLTLQPPYFNHHRPIGRTSTFSDIDPWGDGMNKVAFTHNVRWSTRLNFGKLVTGETDYIDSYKDGKV